MSPFARCAAAMVSELDTTLSRLLGTASSMAYPLHLARLKTSAYLRLLTKEPVVVVVGPSGMTYTTPCEAESRGMSIRMKGACATAPFHRANARLFPDKPQDDTAQSRQTRA